MLLAHWRDETARSSISHSLVSKIIPNLPILGIYHKLKGIMVNKGWIHRELKYFQDIFWKLIKSDEKLMVEIGKNGILWKKTLNDSTESRIIENDLDFVEKSQIEVERNFGT